MARVRMTLVALVTSLSGAALAAPPTKPAAFAICTACHNTAAGEKAALGPNLWQVGGRKAASGAGFAYSTALKNSGIVWNKDQLVSFITSPQKAVPGTKMFYVGQKNPQIASDIADYVLSLK